MPLSNAVLVDPLYAPAVASNVVGAPFDKIQLDTRSGGIRPVFSQPITNEQVAAMRPGTSDTTNPPGIWNFGTLGTVNYFLTIHQSTSGSGIQGSDPIDNIVIGVFVFENGTLSNAPDDLTLFVSGPKVNNASLRFETTSINPFYIIPKSEWEAKFPSSKHVRLLCQLTSGELVTKRMELKSINPEPLFPKQNSERMIYKKLTDQNLLQGQLTEDAFKTVLGGEINVLAVQWSFFYQIDDDTQTKYVSELIVGDEMKHKHLLYDAKYEDETTPQLSRDQRLAIPPAKAVVISAMVFTLHRSFEILTPSFVYDSSVDALKDATLTQTNNGDDLQVKGKIIPRDIDDEHNPRGLGAVVQASDGKTYFKQISDFTAGPDKTLAYPDPSSDPDHLPKFGGLRGIVDINKNLGLTGWFENGTDLTDVKSKVVNIGVGDKTISLASAAIHFFIVNGPTMLFVSEPVTFHTCEKLKAIPTYGETPNVKNGFDVGYLPDLNLGFSGVVDAYLQPQFQNYNVYEAGTLLTPKAGSTLTSRTFTFPDNDTQHTLTVKLAVTALVFTPSVNGIPQVTITGPLLTSAVYSTGILARVYTNNQILVAPTINDLLFTTSELVGDAVPMGVFDVKNFPLGSPSTNQNKYSVVTYNIKHFTDEGCLNEVPNSALGDTTQAPVTAPTPSRFNLTIHNVILSNGVINKPAILGPTFWQFQNARVLRLNSIVFTVPQENMMRSMRVAIRSNNLNGASNNKYIIGEIREWVSDNVADVSNGPLVTLTNTPVNNTKTSWIMTDFSFDEKKFVPDKKYVFTAYSSDPREGDHEVTYPPSLETTNYGAVTFSGYGTTSNKPAVKLNSNGAFIDNTIYYTKAFVTATEMSIIPKVKTISSQVYSATFYKRTLLDNQDTSSLESNPNAFLKKRTVSKLIFDINQVKYVGLPPTDQTSSITFKLKNTSNELTVNLPPTQNLQTFRPSPQPSNAGPQTLVSKYASKSYPNNPLIENLVTLRPETVEDYTEATFYTSTYDKTAGLSVTSLPASTASKRYFADIYVSETSDTVVATYDFLYDRWVLFNDDTHETFVAASLTNNTAYWGRLYAKDGVTTGEKGPYISLGKYFTRSAFKTQDPLFFIISEVSDIQFNLAILAYANDSNEPGSVNIQISNRPSVKVALPLTPSTEILKYPYSFQEANTGYTLRLTFESAIYPNNNSFSQSMTLYPDPPPLYPGIDFFSKLGAPAIPRGFPESTPTNKYDLDILLSGVTVSTVDLMSGVYSSPLTTNTSYQVIAYNTVNGLRSRGSPLVNAGKYHDPPTVNFLPDFMYSSMASQPSPVGEGRLEPILDLSKIVNFQMDSGTVTILATSGTTELQVVVNNYTSEQMYQTLAGMGADTPNMTLRVAILTDKYPTVVSAIKTNIPLYKVLFQAFMDSMDLADNPSARNLFNEDCSLFRRKAYITDEPNSNGLSYSFDDGPRIPIETPSVSEVLLTEYMPPGSANSKHIFTIWSNYRNTANAIPIFRKDLAKNFEPIVDFDKNSLTAKIYSVGQTISSISLLDGNGRMYDKNHPIFTKVGPNYTVDLNSIEYSGWMLSVTNGSGQITEILTGTYYRSLSQVANFTGLSYAYINQMDVTMANDKAYISLTISQNRELNGVPKFRIRVRSSTESEWVLSPYNDSFLEENHLSTQLVHQVENNIIVYTLIPKWMIVLVNNLSSNSANHYTTYEQVLLHKDDAATLSVDAFQYNTLKFIPAGFNRTPSQVTTSDGNGLHTTFLKFSKSSESPQFMAVSENFFFSNF
jgi:hypothetical protein